MYQSQQWAGVIIVLSVPFRSNPAILLDEIAREAFQYQGYLKARFLRGVSPCELGEGLTNWTT
jgi:hypothetical protein